MTAYRIETWPEQMARLWPGPIGEGRPVAMITAWWRCWTATPINVPGCTGWAFTCPTRRQAIAAVTAWLDERNPA